MDRQATINALFDTMDIAKRGMHGRLQVVMNGSSISRTQLELLFTIKHDQPLTSKQLAQQLNLTPGAISQLLDGLDQQHLIEREVDASDRRRQVLRISADGSALLKTIEKRRRTVMEHVMQDLSDEELVIWLRIQQKLISEFQSFHKEQKENQKRSTV